MRTQVPSHLSFFASQPAPATTTALTLAQACLSSGPIQVHANVSDRKLSISPKWLNDECSKLDFKPMRERMEKREMIEYAIMALQTGGIFDKKDPNENGVGYFKHQLKGSLASIDVFYKRNTRNEICSLSVGRLAGPDGATPVRVEIGEEIPAERISFAEPPPKRPRLSTADALGYRKDVQESSQTVTSNNVAAASSSSASVPLVIRSTPYDNLKVDEKVLAELYNLPVESRTAAELYQKLEENPHATRILELVRFDKFLKEKGFSIEDALKNFGAHVQLENAFSNCNKYLSGIPMLRPFSFPTTPSLSAYRSAIGEDEWNTLSKDKQKKLQFELYSVDRHLACRGQHIDTLLGNPDNPREFLEQTQGIRTNHLLRPLLRLLRQNKLPLPLDTKLADKIDLMETTDNQKKAYGQLALDLADYACLQGIGDDADAFIERIRSALAGVELDSRGPDAEFLQTIYTWTGNKRDMGVLLRNL